MSDQRMPSSFLVAPSPVWIRLPKTGENEYFTGLSRSALSKLCADGKVASRREGTTDDPKKGALLIRLASLLEYLEA